MYGDGTVSHYYFLKTTIHLNLICVALKSETVNCAASLVHSTSKNRKIVNEID